MAAERGLELHQAHCASCHGDTGSERINGILGGQWQAHLTATLEDVATGLSVDVPQAMTDAVAGLSAGQRADLVAYYASLGADSDAPSAPTDLAIAARTEYSLTLTWLDADDGWPIDYYRIIRDGFVVAEVSGTVYTDSGLASDQVYNYQVVAVDTAGNPSNPSIGIAARTLGEPGVIDPSVDAGRDLWDGNNCGSCHVSASHLQEQLDARGLGFTEAFNTAITSNAGGMGSLFGGMSAQDIADVEAYLAAAEPPDASLEGIRLLDNQGLLRKAAILLAGRLPTPEEIDQAGDEAGLRTALRGLMQGERFAQLVRDTARRQFLGAGADLDGSALRADFPRLALWYDTDRASYDAAKDDLRREPEELVVYLAENDLSFDQVLSADFTMVNRRLAAALGAELPAPFTGPEDDQDEWVPARVPSLSARTEALAASPYPHAGVLSTRAWLTRFPTTDTNRNRNRHRAKMALMQFLGFDIEALGQRPLDDSANGDYRVPTVKNPNCVLCHDIMEPVAGGFMDWGTDGSYRPVAGEHALGADYTGADYARDHGGEPWFDLGDNWYRDMFDPGHADRSMPGAHFGFNDWDQAWRILDRSGWSVVEQPAFSAADSLEQAFDGDPATIYHSAYTDGDVPMPHVFTVDMGAALEIEALRYLPRQRTSAQWDIADYELQLSTDGATWQTVASGDLVGETRTIDAKLIRFAPRTARFFRLIARSQEPNVDTRQLSVIAELDVIVANAPGTVPYAENANGADNATGWLGRELAEDPRFASGAASMGACWPGAAVTLLRPTALGPQAPQGRSVCATICPSRNPMGRPSCRSPRSSSSTGSPHSCHCPADGLDSPARSPMIPAPTNVFAPLPEASLRWYLGRNIAHGAVESPILSSKNHPFRLWNRNYGTVQ